MQPDPYYLQEVFRRTEALVAAKADWTTKRCPPVYFRSDAEFRLPVPQSSKYGPNITISGCDSLSVPGISRGGWLVLNMANPVEMGGGVKRGAMAQEEELFRRSSYCASMKHEPAFYPLSDHGMLLDKDVVVFKDRNYDELDDPFTVSFLAVAAVYLPKTIDTGDGSGEHYVNPAERELMREKIEAISKVAAVSGHRKLVLGALGCGVFENPPIEVARMFREAVTKYAAHFSDIVFAILPGGSERGKRNLEAFCQVFTSNSTAGCSTQRERIKKKVDDKSSSFFL